MAKKEKDNPCVEPNVGADDSVRPENEQIENEPPDEPTELHKLNDRLLRTMAEYDNYRKRTARERIELEADITAKVVTEFLPALDNLERALQAECKDENFKKGIGMIHGGFIETLKNLGVSLIETDGEFNPAEHQAVQKVSEADFESNQITQTFQKGYKIGEKIIRFAMVAVNE
ncbi:MAG: nucleotide exchange factor GrpE [Oscillospiraceae bacterium]|nr:nucleotide exchange factor GrpE [Oscillospiraceae bacterium]